MVQSSVPRIGLLGIIVCSQAPFVCLRVSGVRVEPPAEMPATFQERLISATKAEPLLPEASKTPMLRGEQVANPNKTTFDNAKQDTEERNTPSDTTVNTHDTDNIIPAEITDNSLSPEKLALIQELLQVTEQKKNAELRLETMLTNMEETLPQVLAKMIRDRTTLEGDDLLQRVTVTTQRMVKRYRELLPSRIDIGEITETITTDLYAKYYTEQELQDLIDFYKTPTGRKAIATLPQLTEEAIKQSNDILLPKITQLLQEIMQEEFGSAPFKPRQKNKGNTKP